MVWPLEERNRSRLRGVSVSIESKADMAKRMKSKQYRQEYVESHLRHGISTQVLALRKQRGWTQKDIENKFGIKQGQVVRAEDPDYEHTVSLKTLLALASAFDVALMVSFAPFGELIEWAIELTPQSLEVPSFEDDPECQTWLQMESSDSLGMADMPSIAPRPSVMEGNSTATEVHVHIYGNPFDQLNA